MWCVFFFLMNQLMRLRTSGESDVVCVCVCVFVSFRLKKEMNENVSLLDSLCLSLSSPPPPPPIHAVWKEVVRRLIYWRSQFVSLISTSKKNLKQV